MAVLNLACQKVTAIAIKEPVRKIIRQHQFSFTHEHKEAPVHLQPRTVTNTTPITTHNKETVEHMRNLHARKSCIKTTKRL